AEDGIRDRNVTGVQTCALPISIAAGPPALGVDTDAEAPAGTVPKAWEEAVRRLCDSRYLVAGHQPQVLLRHDLPSLEQAAVGQRSEERRVGKEGRPGAAQGP